MTSERQSNGIMRTVSLIAAFGVLLIIGFIYTNSLREKVASFEELREQGVYLYSVPRLLPEIALIDDHNNAMDAESFKGQWSVLFFGFTFCPDVCPTTMAVIKRWYEQELDPKLREQTKVYLVTVDPARDTPEQLKPYVDYFNPEFIGITGEFLDLHRFATALNVPFAKVPGSDENYLVDHGASVAIISPDGYFSGFWKPPITVEKLSTTFPDIVKNLSR